MPVDDPLRLNSFLQVAGDLDMLCVIQKVAPRKGWNELHIILLC
jgi:hypothetical protein